MALREAFPVREQNARRFLAIAATLGVLGVLFNLNRDDDTLPKLLALAAVIALVWSLHRYGRLGPDEALVFEEAEPDAAPKKKKKKKKRAGPDGAAPPTSPDTGDP
jgi:hypothetical protein